MPFHGVIRQLREAAIKVEGFLLKLRLGGKFAPGNGEGQEYIYGNISRSSPAQKTAGL
jgi:hypothetical protein